MSEERKRGWTVVFNHGKESGPWGSKISRLAEVAEARGAAVISIDYQGMDEPAERVAKLSSELEGISGPVVLVGSSMGGYVAARAVATAADARGLFLMAPAAYLADYPGPFRRPPACAATVVHGWADDVVPVEIGIRLARELEADLHLLWDGHRLAEVLDEVAELFDRLLQRLGAGS